MLVDKLKSSLSLSFLDKYVGYSLRLVATVMLARLCSPHEIGIFSVAFVMISVGHVLRDFGVAQYLIAQPNIDREKIRASLTMMWGIAWGLFALLWVFKGQISLFYQEPELEHAIEVLSIIFLLAPFGSVRIALLRREMDFGKLARINIGSYLALHGVTLYMAWVGWGLDALVWGQVAGVIATLLGTIYYSPPQCWHWPGLKGMRDVYRFGLPLCAANILETSSDGAGDLILGKTMSMQSVGLFGKAQSLMNLFKIAVTSAIWPVVLPYFSIKNRNRESLLPDYLKAMQMYMLFAWPFFVGLWFFTEPFVLILFGDQWIDIIPLVRVLCFVAAFQAIFPFYNALLVAKGKVVLNLRCQVVFAILKVLAVCGGATLGLLEVTYFLLAAEVISFIILYMVLQKAISIKMPDVLSAICSPSILVGCLIPTFILVRWGCQSYELHQTWQLAIPVVLGLVMWALHLKITEHFLFGYLAKPLLGIIKGVKYARQ